MRLQSIVVLFLLSMVFRANAEVETRRSPQELFIRFEATLSPERQRAFLQAHGLSAEWQSQLVPGLIRVRPQSSLVSAATLIPSLSQHAGIRYVEPDHRTFRKLDPMPVTETFTAPTDPMTSRQWALNSSHGLNLRSAWEQTTGSRSVRVAVLDTGIQADHPELSDRIMAGYDFIDRDNDPSDSHGHGTHVSGIIGARWDNQVGIAGINENVTVIPIRVVPDDDDETDGTLMEAFEYAVQQGARVANCSFGKSASSQAVRDVIEAAGVKGLLVIVAAGNSNQDIGRFPSYPASFQTSNMLVVAASNSMGNLSSFSNYSPLFVHIAAPGSQILSSVTNSRFAAWDGTSMAAPQVAGVAALALAANPNLSTRELREVLVTSVSTRSSMRGRVSMGGIIDASQAVLKAVSLR